MLFDGYRNKFAIPAGHVWIQGDNLSNSIDSRYYGPVPESYIEGRVFYRIWPWKSASALRNNTERVDDPEEIEAIREMERRVREKAAEVRGEDEEE